MEQITRKFAILGYKYIRTTIRLVENKKNAAPSCAGKKERKNKKTEKKDKRVQQGIKLRANSSGCGGA